MTEEILRILNYHARTDIEYQRLSIQENDFEDVAEELANFIRNREETQKKV